VRLDEWQKYIEAQFLDDVETAAEEPLEQTSAAALPEPPRDELDDQAAYSQSALPEPFEAVVISDRIFVVDQQIPTSDAIGTTDPDPVLSHVPEGNTTPPAPPSATQGPLAASMEPILNGRIAGFGSLPELDVPIPDFDSYLPPSHRGSRVVTQESPATPTPATPTAASSPEQDSKATANDVPHHADRIGAVSEHTAFAVATESAQKPLRRAPRSRARHARNVRPDHVPSGLSASELWATVPKHVQTLLALERLEEDQEVAQFSYKRPFQEKRHELIERLLDPILSLEDAARLLNVCPTTVRRYTNKGILTYYRKEPAGQGQNRASRADLNAHDEEQEAADRGNAKKTRQRRFRLSDILAFLETQQAALEADRQAEQTRTQQLRKRRVQQDERSDLA